MGAVVRKVPKHARLAERRRQTRRRGMLEELESLFGPAPLLEGEDEIAYLDFFDRVRAAVKPRDFIDEIFARELADLQWEVLRHRRDQALVQRAAFRKAALRRIRSISSQAARTLEDQSIAMFNAAWKLVFKKLGITHDEVRADALTLCLEEVEHIEALVRKTQARWNAMRRESERRREAMDRVEAALETPLLAAPCGAPEASGEEDP